MDKWEPIEFAPKDGRILDLLVWHKYYEMLMRVTDCWYTGGEWVTSSLLNKYLLVDSYTEVRYFIELPKQPKE